MSTPNLRFLFDRKKRRRPGKPGVIELEISTGNRRKWIATGISVLPRQWDEIGHVVNHPDALLYNQRLAALKKKVTDYLSMLFIKDLEFTFEGLNTYLKGKKTGASLLRYIEKTIHDRTDIRDSTKRTHRKLVAALADFGHMLTFEDVSRHNVLEFDQFLHSRKYLQSTVHSYHKFLKIYLHKAILDELLDDDPYKGIRIDQGRSALRKYLTDEEIMAIKEADLPPDLDKARDLFLFQYYTGLAFSDMVAFDIRNVVKRGDRHILHDTRTKSNEDYYIVLLPCVMKLLGKWNNALPMMTNQAYNRALKRVAQRSGIAKRITSHMARHSFAVNALNSGIQIEVVSRMMGHTNISTTQIYAKIINSSVDRAFDILERKSL